MTKKNIVILYLATLTIIRVILGYESSIFAGMVMIIVLLITRPEQE